jgi:uroporphyrinogen-III synthase
LFPCGNLKRDVLPDNLARAGIELKIVECYKTEQADDLESCLHMFSEEFGSADFAAFFSPSGVKFSWPVVTSLFPDFKSSCKFISIGPVTTEVLEAKECSRIFTAATPNVEGLIEAFKAAVDDPIL